MQNCFRCTQAKPTLYIFQHIKSQNRNLFNICCWLLPAKLAIIIINYNKKKTNRRTQFSPLDKIIKSCSSKNSFQIYLALRSKFCGVMGDGYQVYETSSCSKRLNHVTNLLPENRRARIEATLNSQLLTCLYFESLRSLRRMESTCILWFDPHSLTATGLLGRCYIF